MVVGERTSLGLIHWMVAECAGLHLVYWRGTSLGPFPDLTLLQPHRHPCYFCTLQSHPQLRAFVVAVPIVKCFSRDKHRACSLISFLSALPWLTYLNSSSTVSLLPSVYFHSTYHTCLHKTHAFAFSLEECKLHEGWACVLCIIIALEFDG